MKKRDAGRMLASIWLALALLLALAAGAAAEAQTGSSNKKLQNGSFEEGQSWTADKGYQILSQDSVPSWNTTASDKMMELFHSNYNTYIPSKNLVPPDGTYAAELNANEESTLYQVLQTEPSSLYEWSLYHGARTARDALALIVGPEQAYSPTKPGKTGRDQFMQMGDWLKSSGNYDSSKYYDGHLYDNGTPIVVYSKKFGPNGTFEDNDAGNAFSMTPSSIHTEEWYIWLMQDAQIVDEQGNNVWTEYGAKANIQAGANQQGSTGAAQSEYYRYMVPEGQTSTIFAFVSMYSEQNNKSFGNFLDCVNFEIYHHLTASRTAHGTATVAGDDMGTLTVPNGAKASAYVPDGEKLTLTATTDSKDSVFAGVYCRQSSAQTEFIASSDTARWTVTPNADGTKTYVCKDVTVNGECDLHFVFVKSPTITYDSNGGDPYNCGQTGTGEAANVYSFKPNTGEGAPVLVGPYESHKATKTTTIAGVSTPDTDWRFMGWMLMDDTGNTIMLDDTDGRHRVACNYSFSAGSSEGGIPKQQFLVIGKNAQGVVPEFDTSPQTVTIDGTDYSLNYWKTPAGATEYYGVDNGLASGLTFIAQWAWRQTYTPKTEVNGAFVPADAGEIAVSIKTSSGGTTALTPVVTENEGYSKSYFAEQQETMYVVATAKEGYEFVGWYEPDGTTLVTTKNILSYTVGREDVLAYEAHFVGTAKQTYIRQIKNDAGEWVTVPEGMNVAALNHDGYQVRPGTEVSCTPGQDTQEFAFLGWYKMNAQGGYDPVDPSYVVNGKTLEYTVEGNATYYARFVPKVYFEVRYVNSSNSVAEPPVPGEACGTVNPQSVSLIPGETIPSTASANPGYDFVGWYDGVGDDKQLLGRSAGFPNPMPAESKTYYAMFTARIDSHYSVEHIKVKPDGTTALFISAIIANVPTGTQVNALPVTIPKYTYQPNPFTVNGNTFASCAQDYVKGNGQTVLTLYYAPDDVQYQIEYYWLNANGSETLRDTVVKTAKADETIRLAEDDALKNRYKNDGYVYAAAYGRNKLEGVATADPTLVLKVYYQPKACTVIFNMHDHGVQVPSQTVAYGQTATEPDAPAELGYTFEGWYKDANYTETYSFSAPVEQDVVEIHARWSRPWEVRFHMQGHGDAVPTQKVADGQTAAEPNPAPSAQGYSFRGWYTDETYGTPYDFSKQVKSDIDLYAKWTANVTVTKEWQGGSPAPVQVRLLRDGQPYQNMPDAELPDAGGANIPQTCEQLLNADNSWTHTWTNLPPDSEYTVEEMVIPENYTAVYSKEGENSLKITNIQDRRIEATITNTHRSDTIGMVIRKEWEDANNRNRPGSVRVQIKNARTGDVLMTAELSAANDWTWRVADLPRRENGGETARYLVEEVGENAGYSVSCDIAVGQDGSYTVTLTNVLTGKLDIAGEKIWADDGDRDGTRPNSVQLKIYQSAIMNENLVRIVVVTPDENAGVNDPWTWTVEDLPMYDAFGARIAYFVVEDPVPDGYADPGPTRIPPQST